MKKFLIFGGGGFVGGNLATLAHQNGWEVAIADRTVKPGLNFAHWKTVDITSRLQVEQIIADFEPQIVVNQAAMAVIDQVEKERELAWKVNVDGAKNIADCCAQCGIRHIYFSSDAVFDGTANCYAEDAQPNPVNFYGHTKIEAEKAVLQSHLDSVVLRISLVLGFPVIGGNSFFAGLETKLKYGQDISVPKEEIRTPVDVFTLSECVLELAENTYSGLLHIGGTESIDRYTLTRTIARQMEFDEAIIVLPKKQNPNPDRAPRHRNGILDVSKAQRLLNTKLLKVDEGIQRAFVERIQQVET